MTTIAYRDGVLAADTGMCVGGARIGRMIKIARRDDGWLAGACGDASYAWGFLQWFLNDGDGDPPEGRETEHSIDRGAIFEPDGPIHVLEPQGRFEVMADFYAIGSGAPEARGAMQVGASAPDAVLAAIMLDVETFGDITILRHDA